MSKFIETLRVSIKPEIDFGEDPDSEEASLSLTIRFDFSDYLNDMDYVQQYYLLCEMSEAMENLIKRVGKLAQFQEDMDEAEGGTLH